MVLESLEVDSIGAFYTKISSIANWEHVETENFQLTWLIRFFKPV